MGVKKLDKEIADYLLQLNTEQKKVVLSVVKSFAREDNSRWDNQQYIDEMDRRLSELESGAVKSLTLETLASEARKAYIKK